MGVAFDDECLESGINLHHLLHLLQVGSGTEERSAVLVFETIADEGAVGRVEVLVGKSVPEAACGSIGHMVDLHCPRLVVEAAAEIDHAKVEEWIAVAEVAEVYEVFPAGGHEDAVTELQVAMDSRVGVRSSGDVIMHLPLLHRCEVRISLQHGVEPVFDILETGGVHMRVMQFEAHLCELARVHVRAFRIISARA